MSDFSALLSQGATHAWLFIPSAILLGALHGLEPGHSKTMMAAFIVAVRGTPAQAVLLGLCATISHTLLVWIIALVGIYLGRQWNMEAYEVYFQLASGIAIIAVASWMSLSIWRSHQKGHIHSHSCNHALKPQWLKTEATPIISIKPISAKPIDHHAAAHAHQIQQQFIGGTVTQGQIIMFGLTGGLIPCPASITVLLLCLQLKEIALGASLVLCFSIGLALTLIGSGLVAAWSLRHLKRWKSPALESWINKAPYLSGALVLCVGIFVMLSAVRELLV